MTRVAILSAGAVAALLLCAVAAWALLLQPRVAEKVPTGSIANAAPVVELRIANAHALERGSLRARIDDREIEDDAIQWHGDVIRLESPKLEDGRHTFQVMADGAFVGAGLDERWSITVDTIDPEISFTTPKGGAVADAGQVAVEAITEPGATVAITTRAGTEDVVADDRGRATANVELPDGPSRLVAVAEDAAGNRASTRIDIVVDSVRPRLVGKMPTTVDTDTPTIPLRVVDTTSVRMVATADGERITTRRTAPGRWSVVAAEALHQGRHRMEVTVTDRAGHQTVLRFNMVVDSSEELTPLLAIGPGALGNDVQELHRLLQEKGFFSCDKHANECNGMMFGAGTMTAVKKFQQDNALPVDGVAGQRTLAAMLQRIVISLSSHTLTLYEGNDVVRTYTVAVGSAKYPTPTGEFRIIDMQQNPTWNPPDSDWAKDAEPIPPGPNNPLGTRWMGLDADAVGIHGTPNPESLGYSVSHGCIRMAIPEVEELFELVDLGTPVSIVA